jgi:hypothetical protein
LLLLGKNLLKPIEVHLSIIATLERLWYLKIPPLNLTASSGDNHNNAISLNCLASDEPRKPG